MANTIKMSRTDAAGKITLADVHPAEVENFKHGGYQPMAEAKPVALPPVEADAVTIEEAAEVAAVGVSTRGRRPAKR